MLEYTYILLGGTDMKSTGIVRPVDRMGRIVIPKEIRAQLNVTNDKDSFEIFMDGDRIILKKYQPTCVFCDSVEAGVDYCGHSVCNSCVEKLKLLAEQEEE